MNAIITVEEVHFKYEDAEQEAVRGASFQVQRGEWVSLVGKNGSGKSTLSRLIDGLLEATSGRIVVAGKEVNEENIWSIRQHIGMVFQNPDNQFVGATVEDDVAFGLENRGMSRDEMQQRVAQALQEVQMWEFRDKEPSQLSGGQKQRVALAGIIAQAPDIIILDEATSMLDPEGRQEVMRVLQMMRERYDVTLISITHDVEEVSLSDRMIVMNEGKIILSDSPASLFVQEETMDNIGLYPPFSEQLRRCLAKKGYPVPSHYMTKEELEDWLWTYNSKT